MATPAHRIHGSGYSSSSRSHRKSKPYTLIKDEVLPASSRKPSPNPQVQLDQPKTHRKHNFSMGSSKIEIVPLDSKEERGKLSFGPIDQSKMKIDF